MEKKTERAAEAAEVKKHLEALTGHKIDVNEEQLLKLFYPVGNYLVEEGTTAWRSLLFPRMSCSPANLLDVTGLSATDATGVATFKLSSFMCPENISFVEPINVVATPRSTSPFFVTQTHELIENGNDIQITVYAWNANGAAAPNVSFDWRCQTPFNYVIQ